MAHRALSSLPPLPLSPIHVSIYAEGLVDAFAHATIVRASRRILHGDRLGHPSDLRREDDGFYWMWKGGFTHGVVVCGRVKGTLRIALRNGTIVTIDELVKICRRSSEARFIISLVREVIISWIFFTASPRNELTPGPICEESRISLNSLSRDAPTQRRACVSVSPSQSACINVRITDRSDRKHFAHASIIRLGALSSEDDDVIYRNRPRRDCSVRRWMNAPSHYVSRREIAVDAFSDTLF